MLCLHDHAPSSGNNVFASMMGQLNIYIRTYQKKVGVFNKSRQENNIQIGTENPGIKFLKHQSNCFCFFLR